MNKNKAKMELTIVDIASEKQWIQSFRPSVPQALSAFPFLMRILDFCKQLSFVINTSCKRILKIFICIFWHNSGDSAFISSYARSSWSKFKQEVKTKWLLIEAKMKAPKSRCSYIKGRAQQDSYWKKNTTKRSNLL